MTKRPNNGPRINPGVDKLREFGSKLVLNHDPSSLPARALLKSTGVIDDVEDIKSPLVTIIDAETNKIPGHVHLGILADIAADVLKERGFKVIRSHVGGVVCDGVPMGTFGMNYSLPSRELIAYQIETDVVAQPTDGVFLVGSCDKIVPAMAAALGRINIPGMYIGGGPMLAGKDGLDIVNGPFEDMGAVLSGKMDYEEAVIRANEACPGYGHCSGYFTASTMNCILEVLGITLSGNGTVPAMVRMPDGTMQINPARIKLTELAAHMFADAVENDLRPLDLMTLPAFLNAVRYDVATAGSTNSDLHLRAIARACDIDLTTELMKDAAETTPNLVKITPSRRDVHMEDYDRVGGVSTVMKELAKKKIGGRSIIENTKTVTGKPLLENIANAPEPDGDIIRKVDGKGNEKPYSESGGLTYLKGNLADCCIVKSAGVEPENRIFVGKARVYNSQDAAMEGLKAGEVEDGEVIVITYEGPKGGPGCQEMLRPSGYVKGAGMNNAMITDGRYSGGTRGPCIGHISPEAAAGGPIGKIRNGDWIKIDMDNGTIDLMTSKDGAPMSIEEIAARAPTHEYKSRVSGGWLQVYEKLALNTVDGAGMDPTQVN